MGYAIYEIEGRDCGYAVPAICDHPDCDEEIDRGLAFCCGGEPGSEQGCGLYFCDKHLTFVQFINDNGEYEMSSQLCDPCAISLKIGGDNWKLWPKGYEAKPDSLKWILWKRHHASWETWRKENPKAVKRMDEVIAVQVPAYKKGVMKELEEWGLWEKDDL